MRRLTLLCYALLFTALPTMAAATADSAYNAIRGCYRTLLETPRSTSGAYGTCAAQFVQVARAYPDHPRAAEAWYSIGLVERLRYQRKKDRGALSNALKAFRTVATSYDTHRLADDALYQTAQLTAAGLGKTRKAQRLLQQLLQQHPTGDRRDAAHALFAKLSAGGRYTMPRLTAPQTASITTATPPAASAKPRTAPLAGVRIVLDPGHGGQDPGAKGPTGALEKQVVLDISNRLAVTLRRHYGATVLLTRSTDHYLTLGERNRVGNKAKADLFISIHANAANNRKARGVQTYYLNNATDAAAKRLAARENATAGANQSELDSIVSTMLQNAFTEESEQLASSVQSALVQQLRTKFDRIDDAKVHSALFYVLVGAKSPAILVETSFISHPEEEQRLRDSAYQETVAAGIAKGIAAFWKSGRQRTL